MNDTVREILNAAEMKALEMKRSAEQAEKELEAVCKAVGDGEHWKEKYEVLEARCEEIRGISQHWCDRATVAEKVNDELHKSAEEWDRKEAFWKATVATSEKEIERLEAERDGWQAEAERWRKARCGEAGEQSKPLSAWKNYDHTAEIEAVRDELERTQNIIAEKERKLERRSHRSVCGPEAAERMKQIANEVWAETCRDHGVKEDLSGHAVTGEAEAKKIIEEIFADLPEEEHPAITRMNKAVERAKQGTVFGVAEGVAALPTKDMIERLPKGYTFYGKGPLKHLSIVDDDEVDMWDSECSLWDISSAYEGSDVGEFYALKNGSQVAIANGVLSFPHGNPVKDCADGLREVMGEYCKSLEKSVEAAKHEFLGKESEELPNVVINIYL